VPTDRESLRFPSPLKAKARPLRGVMLAYHALAYITALYDALERAGVTSDRRGLADELARLRAAADAAEATCLKARHLLTAHGRHFLDQTYEGVRHGTGG
jgi:HEXXH motif-containing protein